MTRYFMTIPEASCLVIHAGAYAKDGEVFILIWANLVKIYDWPENGPSKATPKAKFQSLKLEPSRWKTLLEELLVSTE